MKLKVDEAMKISLRVNGIEFCMILTDLSIKHYKFHVPWSCFSG